MKGEKHMMELKFEKLYRYPRIAEPCYIGIPVKKGLLKDLSHVAVLQDGKALPLQKKVTSYHKDGSVRFMFLRFMADLPANAEATLQCDFDAKLLSQVPDMQVEKKEQGIVVDTGALSFAVENHSSHLFSWLEIKDCRYEKEQFVGPLLEDGDGCQYAVEIEEWKVLESGPVATILSAKGHNVGEKEIAFTILVTAYANKPWVEIAYRIINTTEDSLHIASLQFHVFTKGKQTDILQLEKTFRNLLAEQDFSTGERLKTTGILELEEIEKQAPVSNIRTCVASSNYKTNFYVGKNGKAVCKYVDGPYLVKESNEHISEVFYGTFFADYTDSKGGICATIYQAQQNYPKAVMASDNGISVMLVPKDVEKVEMQSGMSREQRFMLHFHASDESLLELDNRSLIYQMPDRPYLAKEVYMESGIYPDMFPKKRNMDVEQSLIAKADGHSRCYGMLNFGDSPDPNYTEQGRGNGELVWCNNEYDYPHACALEYVRTGIRRFLDYNIASCRHWMDVDVCHYHVDPLYIGGQWEHTNGHCKNGAMVCSHEWVEGLLDYYHFTGDERGLETAIGIGENVLRLLDTPMYAGVGEMSARETGWALRSLTALYVETSDEKWLSKCKWILDNFKLWEEKYGNWLAPYTDNTVIRVGFMISVAVGSVMRYYREFPDEEIKQMILRAVDDLIESCYMEEIGLFYYKELPSLKRLGNNTLLLEALAIAFELTGDEKYLKPGILTFKQAIAAGSPGVGGGKKMAGDAVVVGNATTKTFAQSFIPLITYYSAISRIPHMLEEIEK